MLRYLGWLVGSRAIPELIPCIWKPKRLQCWLKLDLGEEHWEAEARFLQFGGAMKLETAFFLQFGGRERPDEVGILLQFGGLERFRTVDFPTDGSIRCSRIYWGCRPRPGSCSLEER